MKFVRYREKWAHGESQWEWKIFPDSATEDDYLEFAMEHSQSYWWSDKFRGVEHEESDVPENVLAAFVKRAEEAVEAAKKHLDELKRFRESGHGR